MKLAKQRPIVIDSAVQAALWRDWRPGDRDLNAVLRRKLGLGASEAAGGSPIIIFTERAGVGFVEGFEIFRHYKGQAYHAQAVAGGWLLLETGEVFASLNKLSRGIGTGVENAWSYWRYRDAAGLARLVGTLRRKS
jgi:hypothetical protein